jgi:chemotaxis signal transduction protein
LPFAGGSSHLKKMNEQNKNVVLEVEDDLDEYLSMLREIQENLTERETEVVAESHFDPLATRPLPALPNDFTNTLANNTADFSHHTPPPAETEETAEVQAYANFDDFDHTPILFDPTIAPEISEPEFDEEIAPEIVANNFAAVKEIRPEVEEPSEDFAFPEMMFLADGENAAFAPEPRFLEEETEENQAENIIESETSEPFATEAALAAEENLVEQPVTEKIEPATAEIFNGETKTPEASTELLVAMAAAENDFDDETESKISEVKSETINDFQDSDESEMPSQMFAALSASEIETPAPTFSEAQTEITKDAVEDSVAAEAFKLELPAAHDMPPAPDGFGDENAADFDNHSNGFELPQTFVETAADFEVPSALAFQSDVATAEPDFDLAAENAPAFEDAAIAAAINNLPETVSFLKERFIVFCLDEALFAFSAAHVAEIGQPLDVTPLPFVRSWFLGICNLRGDILPVVGLRELWERPTAAHNRSKMLVLRSYKMNLSVGLMVDAVREMRRVGKEEIYSDPTQGETPFAAYQIGIVDYEGQKLCLLDAEKMLETIRG